MIQEASPSDWEHAHALVIQHGGIKSDPRDDDVFMFPDQTRCRIRGLTFVAGHYSHREEKTLPKVEVDPVVPKVFTGDILPVIDRLRFVVAKSMPQIPHEYVCRLLTDCDDDYVALYDAVMSSPVIAAWQGTNGKAKNQKPLRYLHVGGYWYWSMSSRRTVAPVDEGRHPLWLSHHINRCTDDHFTNMQILRN
jgi:hypothetical protein